MRGDFPPVIENRFVKRFLQGRNTFGRIVNYMEKIRKSNYRQAFSFELEVDDSHGFRKPILDIKGNKTLG